MERHQPATLLSDQSLFDRSDFRIGPNVIHLTAGAESAFLWDHDQALLRYAHDKSQGAPGRLAQEEHVSSARRLAGRILNVPDDDVGFVSNVAEGISLVAESIRWGAGDNVVVASDEFQSVYAPFLGLASHDLLQVRFVDGTLDSFAHRIDSNTRLIAVSHVSYSTGRRQDLAGVRDLADSVGAMLVVDYSHSAGVLPIDASIADFAFSACYKFLLGCTGVAIGYWNSDRVPGWAPRTAGWNSMLGAELGVNPPSIQFRPGGRRLARGNVSYPSIYVLESALTYLEQFPSHEITRHVESLTGLALGILEGLGSRVLTPSQVDARGPNVCIALADPDRVVEELGSNGIMAVSLPGRLRLSFHGYNNPREVSAASTLALRVIADSAQR